jgi:hypothetical protein
VWNGKGIRKEVLNEKQKRAKKKAVNEDGREICPADKSSSDDQLTRYLEISICVGFQDLSVILYVGCHL